MIGIKNRGSLSTVVLDEFEHLIAGLRGFLLKQHNEDGTHITSQDTAVPPTGGVILWTTATAPSGWLLCNGDNVDRVFYKALFDTIGITYGAGNGSTTFTLPDLRGKFPLGKAAAGTGSTLAGTGGSIDHTHTGPSHDHSFSDTSSSNGSHDHTFSATSSGNNNSLGPFNTPSGATTLPENNHTHTVSGTTSSDGSHTHTVSGTTGTAGNGATGTANPPFIALNYIIKT
jgi:microcystin-dependent protein